MRKIGSPSSNLEVTTCAKSEALALVFGRISLPAMSPPGGSAAGALRIYVPLDPHLWGLEVIALADFFPDALPRPAHPLVLAVPLLVRRGIVQDLLARQVCGDRLASAGVWAALRSCAAMFVVRWLFSRIRRLDGGEHLGLVEEHLLIGRTLLRGSAGRSGRKTAPSTTAPPPRAASPAR